MARNFNVSFNILGNLDPSLLSALQTAADRFKNLKELTKTVNGQAVKSAKALEHAKSLMSNLEAYKSLQNALKGTIQAQGQERLTSMRLMQQQRAEGQRLNQMQAAYKNLQAVQRQVRSERDAQKSAIEITKRDLETAKRSFEAAKVSGDAQAMSRMSAQIRELESALTRQRAAAKKSSDELKSLNAAVKQGKGELTAQQKLVDGLGRQFEASSNRARQLQETLRQQQQQLAQMRTRIPSSNLSAAESALRAQIDQTTQALNREIAALERRNQIQSNFNASQQNLSNAYSNFQNAVQTAETIMEPFADAAKNAMTFEFAMSKVKSLTQMRNIRSGNLEQVRVEMEALTRQAEQLGATTEFTSTEVANAMGYYG